MVWRSARHRHEQAADQDLRQDPQEDRRMVREKWARRTIRQQRPPKGPHATRDVFQGLVPDGGAVRDADAGIQSQLGSEKAKAAVRCRQAGCRQRQTSGPAADAGTAGWFPATEGPECRQGAVSECRIVPGRDPTGDGELAKQRRCAAADDASQRHSAGTAAERQQSADAGTRASEAAAAGNPTGKTKVQHAAVAHRSSPRQAQWHGTNGPCIMSTLPV